MAEKGSEPKRRRGRPSLLPGEGKRYPLNMRATKELRENMEGAARESGRSLAQEVEFRLERSFLTKDHMALVFGDPKFREFVEHISLIKELITGYTGRSVLDDPAAKASFLAAIDHLLAPPDYDHPSPKDRAESIGIAAVMLLTERLTEKPENQLQLLADKLEADAAKKGG